MAATTSSLQPDTERGSRRLNLTTPQLSEYSADLLEVTMVPAMDPNVSVENNPITGNLRDVLMLPLGVRMPGHLKGEKKH